MRIRAAWVGSLWENFSPERKSVAPTVLRMILPVRPALGLGSFVVARLRRSGFVAPAPAFGLSRSEGTKQCGFCRARLVYAGLQFVSHDRRLAAVGGLVSRRTPAPAGAKDRSQRKG